MKKLLCVALVVVMMLSLVACGTKLSGTYKTNSVAGSYVSYTFSGSKVTFKTVALNAVVAEIEGTYKIDGDKITLTWGDEKNDKALSGELSFKKDGKTITIGALELTKE